MLDTIRGSWGWSGIEPDNIVGENDFGNLLVRDDEGKYWWLCPEELSCEVVAESKTSLDALFEEASFQQDWAMTTIVALAVECVGPLSPGRKYCLKMSGVLGGQYAKENLASLSFVELIEFSGYLAQQIENFPDGTKINFSFDGDA